MNVESPPASPPLSPTHTASSSGDTTLPTDTTLTMAEETTNAEGALDEDSKVEVGGEGGAGGGFLDPSPAGAHRRRHPPLLKPRVAIDSSAMTSGRSPLKSGGLKTAELDLDGVDYSSALSHIRHRSESSFHQLSLNLNTPASAVSGSFAGLGLLGPGSRKAEGGEIDGEDLEERKGLPRSDALYSLSGGLSSTAPAASLSSSPSVYNLPTPVPPVTPATPNPSCISCESLSATLSQTHRDLLLAAQIGQDLLQAWEGSKAELTQSKEQLNQVTGQRDGLLDRLSKALGRGNELEGRVGQLTRGLEGAERSNGSLLAALEREREGVARLVREGVERVENVRREERGRRKDLEREVEELRGEVSSLENRGRRLEEREKKWIERREGLEKEAKELRRLVDQGKKEQGEDRGNQIPNLPSIPSSSTSDPSFSSLLALVASLQEENNVLQSANSDLQTVITNYEQELDRQREDGLDDEDDEDSGEGKDGEEEEQDALDIGGASRSLMSEVLLTPGEVPVPGLMASRGGGTVPSSPQAGSPTYTDKTSSFAGFSSTGVSNLPQPQPQLHRSWSTSSPASSAPHYARTSSSDDQQSLVSTSAGGSGGVGTIKPSRIEKHTHFHYHSAGKRRALNRNTASAGAGAHAHRRSISADISTIMNNTPGVPSRLVSSSTSPSPLSQSLGSPERAQTEEPEHETEASPPVPPSLSTVVPEPAETELEEELQPSDLGPEHPPSSSLPSSLSLPTTFPPATTISPPLSVVTSPPKLVEEPTTTTTTSLLDVPGVRSSSILATKPSALSLSLSENAPKPPPTMAEMGTQTELEMVASPSGEPSLSSERFYPPSLSEPSTDTTSDRDQGGVIPDHGSGSEMHGSGPSGIGIDMRTHLLPSMVDHANKILSRIQYADVGTLEKRLKRQNLPGDVRHLAHTTLEGILTEIEDIRNKYRVALDQERANARKHSSTNSNSNLNLSLNHHQDPSSPHESLVSRKDFNGAQRVFRDLLLEASRLRALLNRVQLDPSLAGNKLKDLDMPSKAAGEILRPARPEDRKASGTIFAPLTRLWSGGGSNNNLSSDSKPGATVPASPTQAPEAKGWLGARPPPKLEGSSAITSATVNVNFASSGTVRRAVSVFPEPVPQRRQAAGLSNQRMTDRGTRNIHSIFAGATPATSGRDPWMIVPDDMEGQAPNGARQLDDTDDTDEADYEGLSPSTDAIIEASAKRNTTLLEHTLRPRGLSDSSIRSTFLTHETSSRGLSNPVSRMITPQSLALSKQSVFWDDVSSGPVPVRAGKVSSKKDLMAQLSAHATPSSVSAGRSRSKSKGPSRNLPSPNLPPVESSGPGRPSTTQRKSSVPPLPDRKSSARPMAIPISGSSRDLLAPDSGLLSWADHSISGRARKVSNPRREPG